MPTLIEHLIKLTDHRDRDLLELTLSKALIGLLPIERVVMARVVTEDSVKRWLEMRRWMRAGWQSGRSLRVDFCAASGRGDKDRLHCLRPAATWSVGGSRWTAYYLFAAVQRCLQ